MRSGRGPHLPPAWFEQSRRDKNVQILLGVQYLEFPGMNSLQPLNLFRPSDARHANPAIFHVVFDGVADEVVQHLLLQRAISGDDQARVYFAVHLQAWRQHARVVHEIGSGCPCSIASGVLSSCVASAEQTSSNSEHGQRAEETNGAKGNAAEFARMAVASCRPVTAARFQPSNRSWFSSPPPFAFSNTNEQARLVPLREDISSCGSDCPYRNPQSSAAFPKTG